MFLFHWGAAETNVSCPQCRETFPQRHMRPNRHLANVTQLVKQLRTERPSGPGGEMGVCEKHREPLKLYCEEDQMPICVVCDRSREHRGHSVLPLEEAVEGFKVRAGRAGTEIPLGQKFTASVPLRCRGWIEAIFLLSLTIPLKAGFPDDGQTGGVSF